MADHAVARVEDVAAGRGLVVHVDGDSVGIFNVGGRFFALRNACLHQGGPACEGVVLPAHRAHASADGRSHEYLDADNPVVCCPWHGWEYDIKTGTCLADPTRRIQSYPVQVVDGAILVTMPGR